MVELADTTDLKSVARNGRVGSSPAFGIIIQKQTTDDNGSQVSSTHKICTKTQLGEVLRSLPM